MDGIPQRGLAALLPEGSVELTLASWNVQTRVDGAFQMAVGAGKRTSQRRLAAGRALKAAPVLVEVLAAASLVTGAASLGTLTL